MSASRYKEAGVDIGAGFQAVELMRQAVESTYGSEVVRGIGAFGGMVDVSFLKEMAEPVLVSSIDGVGTKTKIAAALARYDTVGQDLVNHCVNDILVQGARPLFFLDYVASSHIEPAIVAQMVGGCASACRAAGCALIGGETAEMPGVYLPGEFDLAGAIIGAVDRCNIVDGRKAQPGDAVLGLASTGLHTNGFSLARRVFQDLHLKVYVPELGECLGNALLAVHRSYLDHVVALWRGGIEIRAMAHITSDGLVDNVPRVLPPGVGAQIYTGSWPVLPIFSLIQHLGDVSDDEMRRVFNLGIGYSIIVTQEEAQAALDILNRPDLPGDAWRIGEVVAGEGVQFVDVSWGTRR